ncbi:MAG TPA: circularly permuted type 2 ATP-grasp protein [Vicinamibacterales bacterium]|nr:circularly permuted type 2 ATP-grasp protein [Vicinamibacterales bacterium]
MSTVVNPQGIVPWRLLDGYQPVEAVYDEMVEQSDSFRPHWEPFVRSIEALGRHELASRWESAKRTLRDNGVTYNVYGDPQGADRPWELDLLPLVISQKEWSSLETALIQRTRLLNSILSDIYGPRRLLSDGLLPPAVVFANPAFLRPCHGVPVAGDVRLHLHAVDLARSPDGQWWVLADRTQAPSGAGYALENRIVLSRSLPEAFRGCKVQRLASFFRSYREHLAALAPHHRGSPNVVLLTPGPYNETYFEHAYLARYLGMTLVEGGDLTVRDCKVFIKTLDGLEPVDVIFRRLDDEFCDPLELRSDSSLGTAGLVEAVRTGNVAIANSLGSGVIETPAVLPFLPALCRHLLKEDLLLPSVGTWWCGQSAALEYVLDHLDRLVARRAFPSTNREPVFGRKLNEGERSALVDEIKAKPEDFVGQEQVALSTAPVWLSHRVEPRPIVLRAFIAAAGDTYVVMPGALTRVASARDVPVVSNQRGGGSKDTWVLSDGPVSTVTLLTPAPGGLGRERLANDLPSRVADNLFWLGRHAERAEHVMRLLRSAIVRFTNEDATDATSELSSLLRVLVALELLPAALAGALPARELEQEMFTFVFKPSSPSPLRAALAELRRLASIVRDRLSIDTSRILNQLHQDFRLRHGRIQFDDVLAHLNRMITDLAAFSGMEMENMTRGHGWRFLDVGRRLERSLSLTALLKCAVEVPSVGSMLEPLLEVTDSTMTYRRRYFARPQLLFVLDLLLSARTNPRGLAFQLGALSDHVQRLPRDPKAPLPTREERLIARANVTLRELDLDGMSRPDEGGRFSLLLDGLGSIDEDLRALSDAITYFYFSHAEQRVS